MYGGSPTVRRDLRYSRQVVKGKASYVVKDPARQQYFRFGEAEAWLMQRMDGARSIGAIVGELRRELGLSASEESVAAFVRRLKEMGLAERTFEERRVLLTESRRKERLSRIHGHGSTLLRMRFSLGDPDRLFDALVRRLPFFWTPGFVVLSVAVFILLAVIVAANWPAFHSGLRLVYDPTTYTLARVAAIYTGIVVVFGIHELGHGLTCKRFGGEVHEIGAMIIYLTPAFYCNVNDAWMFERRSHRLWVTFAGTWIQLIVAAVAALVWLVARPGSAAAEFAFICMLIGGGLTVLVNFNPLIPLDGYYALMDVLEMPNLRPRSFGYLSAVLQRNLLRRDVRLPAVTPRERRVFLAYGILAVAYGGALLGGTLFLLSRFLVHRFGDWGWAMVVAALWFLFRRRLLRLAGIARASWIGRGGGTRIPRRPLQAGAAGLLLMLSATIAPWTLRARGDALVEPSRRVWLRSDQRGVVDEILVGEGESVHRGQPLAVIRDPGLEVQRQRAMSMVALLQRRDAELRASGATADAAATEIRLDGALALLRELDARRSTLVLRAPFDAVIATPHVDEAVGASVARGDSLLELWESGGRRIRLELPARESGGLEPGAAVRVRFPAVAGYTLGASVQSISPAAAGSTVEAIAAIRADAPEWIRPGMVGRAKVDIRHASVAAALARAARRAIRLDWFL